MNRINIMMQHDIANKVGLRYADRGKEIILRSLRVLKNWFGEIQLFVNNSYGTFLIATAVKNSFHRNLSFPFLSPTLPAHMIQIFKLLLKV